MSNTNKKTPPTDDVVYPSGEFIGRDGQKHVSYGTIGAAWRDEAGHITSAQIRSIPVNWSGVIYFRTREKAAAETPEGGQQ